MNNNTLSPGRIAKICNVAPRTVCKWIDRGILKGYRMPGGLHRRVTLEDFEIFLNKESADLHHTSQFNLPPAEFGDPFFRRLFTFNDRISNTPIAANSL